jgi:hypothetical protein
MLPVLLLALGAGQTPNNVSLDDLKRFEITNAELRDRIKVARQFREFAAEAEKAMVHRYETEATAFLKGGPIPKTVKGFSSKDLSSGFTLACVEAARDPTRDVQSRLANLRLLRKELGEKDYYAGILPPAYPPKCKRAFEQWQADEKAGRKRLPNGVLKDPT